MNLNFNNTTINQAQFGNNNNMYISGSLTNDDWEHLEYIFNQKLNELDEDTNTYRFLKESKKYINNRDEITLKKFINKQSKEFLKNLFYNITSSLIINSLYKIGIIL